MPDYQGTFVERLLRWRFLFVVNLMIVVFLSLSLGREVVRNKTIESEIHQLQNQAEILVQENSRISELQSALESESYIEREARLKLGMKKPGEEVIVIHEDNSESLVQGNINTNDPLGYLITEDGSSEKLANPSKWWYYFFNKQTYQAVQNYEY